MVTIEPIFAQTVNLSQPYHVFVTPLCQEPALLFVTAKSASSFMVQGAGLSGQPLSCAFDYRIVAKRLGHEDTRLERVDVPSSQPVESTPAEPVPASLVEP